MDLEKYCDEDFINIPKADWSKILEWIGKDKERKLEITTKLAELAGKYPLPVPEITEEEMHKNYDKFQASEIEKITSDAVVRGEPYKYPISNETWKWKTPGTLVADRFFMKHQLQASHRRYRSPASAWGDVSGRRTAFNALVALKKPYINKKMVLTGFKLRLHIAGNFRPTVAKEIYDTFGGPKVLDFSSGYGGRFIGFWGSEKPLHYIGIDPNSMLLESYKELSTWLATNYPKNKTFEFIQGPAEEINYSNLKDVDLVFTSPPYFDLERYSQEDTQSWKKYKGIELWKKEFLFKALKKIYPTITPGGHLIVNICDSPSHDEIRVCDDMCDFVVNELGMEILPAIKLLLTNRPGNKTKVGAAKISEPIWVFRK